MCYLKMLKTFFIHYFYVWKYGIRLGVPLKRLIKHDLSKLSYQEFFDYARWFYGKKDNQKGFDKAWKHHYENNDHHPEFYITESKTGYNSIQPMTIDAVHEMIADWMSACKAYNKCDPIDGEWRYIIENKKELNEKLHPTSKIFLQSCLISNGYPKTADLFIYDFLHRPTFLPKIKL